MPGAWQNNHVTIITVIAPTSLATKTNETYESLEKNKLRNFTVLHEYNTHALCFLPVHVCKVNYL